MGRLRRFLAWLTPSSKEYQIASIEALRTKLQRGRCECGALLFISRSQATGRRMIACENQYGGEDLFLLGNGRCYRSIADVELVQSRCRSLGVPALQII